LRNVRTANVHDNTKYWDIERERTLRDCEKLGQREGENLSMKGQKGEIIDRCGRGDGGGWT
jgi:hypothetical protein